MEQDLKLNKLEIISIEDGTSGVYFLEHIHTIYNQFILAINIITILSCTKDWHGHEDHVLQLSLYNLPSLPLLTVFCLLTSTLAMWYSIRTGMVMRIMVFSYQLWVAGLKEHYYKLNKNVIKSSTYPILISV